MERRYFTLRPVPSAHDHISFDEDPQSTPRDQPFIDRSSQGRRAFPHLPALTFHFLLTPHDIPWNVYKTNKLRCSDQIIAAHRPNIKVKKDRENTDWRPGNCDGFARDGSRLLAPHRFDINRARKEPEANRDITSGCSPHTRRTR